MPKGYSKRNQGGWKHSQESISLMKKNRRSYFNEANPMWKGDDVGNKALHMWIRSKKDSAKECENCKEVKPLDLANISQQYKRDVNDFRWLCKKCHANYDQTWKRRIRNKLGQFK